MHAACSDPNQLRYMEGIWASVHITHMIWHAESEPNLALSVAL